MKRFLLFALAILALATLPAMGFTLWQDDYNTWSVGDNLLDYGYTTFSTYEGSPVIVEALGQKCLQLQPKDGGSTDYNMILTPVISDGWEAMAASGVLPKNFDVVVSATVMPGSGVDLIALYGQSTNRFFYINCNTNGDIATSPGSEMLKVSTTELNTVSARLHYVDGDYHLVEFKVNDQTWTGDVSCGAGDAPRFLRLSTQLSSLPEGGKGAIFGKVGVELTVPDEKIYFKDDFESYEVGTEVAEQPGYAFFNNYNGSTAVVNDWPKCSDKCMVMKQSEGGSSAYVMLLTPAFEMTPRNPGQQLCQFKAKFVCASDTDLIAFYDKGMNRFFYLHCVASTRLMASNPAGVAITNLYDDAESLNELSISYDAMAGKFTSVTLNGQTQAIDISATATMPVRMRLSTQLTSQMETGKGAAYDYIQVGAVNRSENPELYCVEEAVIPLNETQSTLTLYNAGPPSGEVKFTTSKDANWLTVSPTSGEFNESMDLTLTAASSLEKGYYKANLTIDAGEAGTKVVRVAYHNGVIFFEDFNDYTPGNMVGQRGWTVGAGDNVITNAYGCDGLCAFSFCSGGNDGMSRYLPKPWYENLQLKVSADIYVPSGSTVQGTCLLMKESDVTEKVEVGLMPADGGGMDLYYIQGTKAGQTVQYMMEGFPTMPASKWVNVEYSIDLQTQRLLSFGWDGVITNFNDILLESPNCNYYCSYGYAFWDPSNNAKCAIDNIKVEVIERGDEPIPSLVPYKFMGTNTTCTVGLSNAGGGSFDYAVSVLDYAEAVSVKPLSGKVKDVQDLTVTVDRKKLDPGYYRTRIVADCGENGIYTNMVAFSVGNIYYDADFQSPFFKLGNFIGQDDWGSDWEGNQAEIIETNGVQTLLVKVAGGYGGLMHNTQVPVNSMLKVEFDFLLPPNVFQDVESDTVICLKQHDKYTPIHEMYIKKDIVEGVNCVYGQCDEDGSIEMPKVECAGEFLHCCYVYDIEEGRVLEFTIGDEPFYPEEAYTELSDVSCDNVFICVGSGMNVQFANYKVSAIPEPMVLGLLALVALFLRRK